MLTHTATTKLSSPEIAKRYSSARDPMVSMIAVRGLVEALENRGFPRDRVLRELRCDAERLHVSDARLPLLEVNRMCEHALDLAADDALGLHWIESLRSHTFQPVSHILTHIQTLRHAFELLSHFSGLFCDRAFFCLLESANTAIVRVPDWPVQSQRMQRFSAEAILGGLFKMMQIICGEVQLQSASFEYSAPAHHREYARVFNGDVRFEQPFTALVFSRALLDAPAPHADEDVCRALEAVAERRLQGVTQRAPYTFGVRELILSQVPERVSMRCAARSLGLSVRSLRRQLAAEGTSFRELEFEAMESVSKWLLRDQCRTIQDVAYELGFSDVTTFHRAFKRWTGLTPGEFRGR